MFIESTYGNLVGKMYHKSFYFVPSTIASFSEFEFVNHGTATIVLPNIILIPMSIFGMTSMKLYQVDAFLAKSILCEPISVKHQ